MTRKTHSLVMIFALNLASFSQAESPREAEENATPKIANQEAKKDPATRKKLEKYIARFDDKSKWHFGERTPGELAGKWISDNDPTSLLVFAADGSFSEYFNGKMTTGLYAISESGLVVAYSIPHGGGGLGSWFRLEGKNLTGPRGPQPEAIWKRAPVSKK